MAKESNVINIGANNAKRVAAKVVKTDAELAAIISKLTQGKRKGRKVNALPSMKEMEAISKEIQHRGNIIDDITKLFPDIELGIQIIVSSVLSPKDMVSTELIYETAKGISRIFPHTTISDTLNTISSYIENNYGIEESLPTILREALFEKGAYIVAVIPESSVDDIINSNIDSVSTEAEKLLLDGKKSSFRHKGVLGSPLSKDSSTHSAAFESLSPQVKIENYERKLTIKEGDNVSFINNIEVIDECDVLKLPAIIKQQQKRRIDKVYDLGLESDIVLGIDPSSLYNSGDYAPTPLQHITPEDVGSRMSVGGPLVMKLPVESVIPVHVPGDPKSHIGYYVLLNKEGYPITEEDNKAYGNNSLIDRIERSTENSAVGRLLSKARRELQGCANKETVLSNITDIFSDIVERDLISRLKNGIYASDVSIARKNDIYRIMLARSLAGQQTRLLYLPKELVTYIAYKYYDNGVGKSLLDDLKTIASIRAMTMVAKAYAQVRNSISSTVVNIKLDEEDPDPNKTIEMMRNFTMRLRQLDFPFQITNINDMVEWIHNAGFIFDIEGHPALPDTKISMEQRKLEHEIPDEAIEEEYRKLMAMGLGLTPETIDNGFSGDFATTVIANNVLLAKRVIQIQNAILPLIKELIQKIAINDKILQSKVIELFQDEKKEILSNIRKLSKNKSKTRISMDDRSVLNALYTTFVKAINVKLPRMDTSKFEALTESYNNYADSLDKIIEEAFISSDILTNDIAGDLGDYADVLKAVIKAYYLRRWMVNNNYMTELNDIVKSSEEDKPILDIYDINSEHIEGLKKAAMRFLKKVKKGQSKLDEKLANIDSEEEPNTSETTSENPNENEIGGQSPEEGIGPAPEEF